RARPPHPPHWAGRTRAVGPPAAMSRAAAVAATTDPPRNAEESPRRATLPLVPSHLDAPGRSHLRGQRARPARALHLFQTTLSASYEHSEVHEHIELDQTSHEDHTGSEPAWPVRLVGLPHVVRVEHVVDVESGP